MAGHGLVILNQTKDKPQPVGCKHGYGVFPQPAGTGHRLCGLSTATSLCNPPKARITNRMASLHARLPENVPGPFFVDSTCINCDTCRQLAPATFGDNGQFSFVASQPRTEQEQ